MIDIKDIERLGKKKEKENLRFREYLKRTADSDILDKQFKELHEKYFKEYDCSKCRNCCKKCGLIVNDEELTNICKHLDIDKNKFIRKYIKDSHTDYEYTFKHKRCDFLTSNNECLLECIKLKCCIDYPYTDKEERLFSMYGIIENTKICPVVYEIIEELKNIYNFK